MWSAFMNGSGLHGGGGAGGGYVPAQGWEFVPCSRMDRADRGRGKSRSPLRRISSPPTVFSQLYEPQLGASPPGRGEGVAGAQLEVLRGQMWPGPEPMQHQQQQTQHTRLKKKFEDLKKRHIQDKEGWMREKESLLREVAEIQGGENRRILLDLKTVLEEVQAEVKREEEKRSDLQLQYTRDRCAWELERAELKCRIAQLEAREGAGLIGRGVQSAAGLGSVASRSAGERQGEPPTLRREREEQRRLLADTHSTAMDLRCRLEHNERDWSREKAELLERFDVERREWESQLRDMQKKIEELYCEVRAKREGTGLDGRRRDNDDVVQRLSIRSTSTGSSLLSDNSRSEPLSSSSQSETIRHSPLPSFGRSRNLSGCVPADARHHACFPTDGLCSEYNSQVGGQVAQNDLSQPEQMDELRSRGAWCEDTVNDGHEAVDITELDAIFCGASASEVPQKNLSNDSERKAIVSPQNSIHWLEGTYGSDKKKNTTALNAALKEIARVSEELCSYQDEIRKKSGDRRNRSGSLCLPEDSESLFNQDNPPLQVDETPCDLSQIYDDLRALGRENWITMSPEPTWQADREPSRSPRANTSDPDREAQTSPGALSETGTPAPPIPPRSSSRNLNAPTCSDTELHIPDSPMTTVKRCHSPCTLIDRKCSSPSIVRKFGAMLQENEGKVLIDGVVASCPVPTNPKCNIGCCHNRWSCDASKFTNSKLSTHGTVQKSFSEVNIMTAAKDLHSDYISGVGDLKELQMPEIVKDLPVDLLLSSLEISPASLKPQGSRRNIMLEQKTAEFNRTLFQAEMGRGVEEPDSFTVTDACLVGGQSHEVSHPRETMNQPPNVDLPTDIKDVHPELTGSLSVSDSTVEKVKSRQMRGRPEEVRANLSSEKPHPGFREPTSSPAQHSELKHKSRTGSSPSRKTQVMAEPVVPANPQPGQHGVSLGSQSESPGGAKPQPARVAVSVQQPSAENKQRQMTQPGHQAQPRSAAPSQSDSSRPRVMNDHPWKPLTLAAYPRPEGSRSNYGALERILKNYESAARAQQGHSQQDEVSPSPNVSGRKEESVPELDMLDMDPLPLPPTLRHTQTSHTSQTHSTHVQLSSLGATNPKEIHLRVQESDESPASSPSVQKSFLRPARPANRRLPSRWASRSPSSSSSTSSSPSSTPVVPSSFALHKHTSSFTYSHAFHIETVII